MDEAAVFFEGFNNSLKNLSWPKGKLDSCSISFKVADFFNDENLLNIFQLLLGTGKKHFKKFMSESCKIEVAERNKVILIKKGDLLKDFTHVKPQFLDTVRSALNSANSIVGTPVTGTPIMEMTPSTMDTTTTTTTTEPSPTHTPNLMQILLEAAAADNYLPPERDLRQQLFGDNGDDEDHGGDDADSNNNNNEEQHNTDNDHGGDDDYDGDDDDGDDGEDDDDNGVNGDEMIPGNVKFGKLTKGSPQTWSKKYKRGFRKCVENDIKDLVMSKLDKSMHKFWKEAIEVALNILPKAQSDAETIASCAIVQAIKTDYLHEDATDESKRKCLRLLSSTFTRDEVNELIFCNENFITKYMWTSIRSEEKCGIFARGKFTQVAISRKVDKRAANYAADFLFKNSKHIAHGT